MSAADEAYIRLLAAQRVVSQHELDEMQREDEREKKAHRIRRKMQKVY